MKIIPSIEKDTFVTDLNPEGVELQYLILYDSEGIQLAKSDNSIIGSDLELEYDGLIYLVNSLGRISIDYYSMLTKFQDE